MKTTTQSVKACLAAILVAGATFSARAVTFTVDPGATWSGYMNVFETPQNGGAYLWGSGWGVADLNTSWAGPVLSLSPNTIGDPNSYWYTPSGGPGAIGNKIMAASFYQEFNVSLAGQSVTFTGDVLANSLLSSVNQQGNGWTSVAFIKDFAPDYSSFNVVSVPLTTLGVFTITMNTVNDPARHVQFGFETVGPDVWATDAGAYGSVQITAVPEPTMATLLLCGIAGLAAAKRRKTA
jgi:hypothetical protein